jgi:hypothetical protein
VLAALAALDITSPAVTGAEFILDRRALATKKPRRTGEAATASASHFLHNHLKMLAD